MKIAEDVRERIAEQRKDEADKRQLRGKYAPPEGVCRLPSCGGRVVPLITTNPTNLIGGGPTQAFVKRWYCEGCGLMYHAPPKP